MHVVELRSRACLVGGVAVAAAETLPLLLEAVLQGAVGFAGVAAVVVVAAADSAPVVARLLAPARRPPCPHVRTLPRRLQSNK